METFFTKSDKIQHVIQSFSLTKTLYVSSIIIGEANTGKKTLVQYLFPNLLMVSGKNQQEVISALENNNELIISDFEQLSNHNALDFNNRRIIATANYMGNPKLIDELFAFIYTMPSLSKRPKDVDYLKNIFIHEAITTLMIEDEEIDYDIIPIDLTLNNKSLKKSIFRYLTKHTMNNIDIEDLLYNYLLKHLDGNDGYKEYIGLYEKPLIKAGLEKFGSQLQLSKVLGINRNTLRKKIHEHNID